MKYTEDDILLEQICFFQAHWKEIFLKIVRIIVLGIVGIELGIVVIIVLEHIATESQTMKLISYLNYIL